jgi:transposase
MLDQSTRVAILRLREQGLGSRAIATALGVSRGSVRRVLRDGRAEIPQSDRNEKAEPHRDQILQLFATCKGNLVRVHEELVAAGASLSYQALTAFCRRHGIGHPPPPRRRAATTLRAVVTTSRSSGPTATRPHDRDHPADR